MYMLRLQATKSSKFDLFEQDVRAYAAPGNEHRFTIADVDPRRREILVLTPDYRDGEYLVRDLLINEPSIGSYCRLAEAYHFHVTNDSKCLCTPCSEGGLPLVANNPTQQKDML